MQLVTLIQSLSEKERRYFRMYAQLSNKGEKAKFMELFEALIAAEVSNQTAQILKKKTYSAANKTFLVDKILESLRMQDFHITKSPIIEIKEIICYMPILLKKRLFKEMRKRIRYAKQKAIKYELFTDHLAIIQWEKQMLWKEEANNMETLLKELLEEETFINSRFMQALAYQNLKEQITLLRKKDVRLRKPIHQEKFNTLVNTPLLLDNQANKLHSLTAQMHFHYLQSIVQKYQHKNPEMAFFHAQQLNQLYEQNIAIQSLNPKAYKESLCLFSEMAYLSNHFTEMRQVIDKIEKLSTKEPELGIDILNTTCFYGLLCAMNIRDYKEGERVIKVIQKYWQELAPVLKNNRQLAFFYNIFLFYLLFEKWELALPWLEKILQFKRVQERKDIQCIARIWKIILAYELPNIDLFQAMETATKYLKRQSHYGDVEQSIMYTFKQLNKTIELKIHQQILAQLRQKLMNILVQQKQKGTQQLGLQEIIFWCNKHSTHKMHP